LRSIPRTSSASPRPGPTSVEIRSGAFPGHIFERCSVMAVRPRSPFFNHELCHDDFAPVASLTPQRERPRTPTRCHPWKSPSLISCAIPAVSTWPIAAPSFAPFKTSLATKIPSTLPDTRGLRRFDLMDCGMIETGFLGDSVTVGNSHHSL
jgi:hypothetical protein